MTRNLSILNLILPLLALVFANSLSAQTIVVDKTALTFSGQAGGAVSAAQTINITSSTGSAMPFTLSFPSYPWIRVNGQLYGFTGNTPATLTVTADPSGLSAQTYSGSIAVAGGSSSSNPSIGVTFTVSAIGVSPASLAFGYTIGSSTFPASQVLNLSSAGSTQCTATPAYTSGGSWFTLFQTSCVSPGNLTILINTAVVNGLAANTYTGTVTITPTTSPQSPAVVVPLTLIVSPTPPVTVSPASLIFNWQTGIAAANPTQTFTISTAGTQPLPFSFSPPTVDTGSWISTINPPSGNISPTTGTQVTVTVNPTGVAVGPHLGSITLLTPGGSPTQTNIGVTLNVSATPLLNVPNAPLNFTTQLNVTPPAQSVNITSTSTTLIYSIPSINYNPSVGSGWLSVPTAGSTAAPLSVSVNPAGLTPGTYNATINVLAATTGSTTQQIPVVLKVTNDPVLSASVSSLSFPYQIGQAVPGARSVMLTSSTGVPLNYTASLATTTCGSSWLLAANANNSLNGVTNDTLTVSVVTTGLTAAATCSGTLTINATVPATGAAAVGSPINIPVTMYVSTTAQLVLTPPDPLVFSAAVGGFPAPQTITLSSTNSDVLSYQVALQPTGSWLSVNTLGGTTVSNNTLTVTVNPPAAGTYNGTVTISATNPSGAVVADSPVVIPVTLTVTAGSLTLSSTSLTFQQTLGGPAPATQTVTVGSSGPALSYTAVANSNNAVTWLSVAPATGNTSTAGTLTVAVDGSKLTSGNTYTGTIVVTSPGAGNSPATINVSLTVGAGTISAPTTTLTFTQAFGGTAPPAQTIAVTGSPASLSFTVASAMLNGASANWLSATPASGSTPGSVQVAVNGGALPIGQYTGTVTITSSGANGSPIAVPVVLNVVSPSVLAVQPTSLSFSAIIGQAAPPAQTLAVTASGTTANVPFNVQVQFDGTVGQWLVVTPLSSTAPATLSVSIAPSNLTAGTYNGHITLTGTNTVGTVTIPVTLTVTAIPQPVVTSVANAASYSTGPVSPGENIVIFGTGIGPAALATGTIVNNAFTTKVATTRVLFDNVEAPIIYVSTGQTSVMVPYNIYGRTTTSIVVEYSGVQSAPLTYNVAPAAPGIYTLNQQGTGPGAILNQDGVTVNSATAPEKRGNVIAIYMTGEGQTNPQGSNGAIIAPVVSALKKPLLPVTVTIGDIDTAGTLYAGSAPGLVSGVMQVNVIIPANAPTGSAVPVVVTVGTAKTQSGASAATVAIQ